MDAALPGLFYLSERNLLFAGGAKGGMGNGERGNLIDARLIGVTVHNCETGTPITLN